jgi:iron(III) transport system substrate-binding protein
MRLTLIDPAPRKDMIRNPKSIMFRFFALCSLLWWFGCAGSPAREQLLIYSPHDKEMLTHYEQAFEARYPEVDVVWQDMGGQDAYDRIRTERQNPKASLWWGGDNPTFMRAAEEGLLAPYRPTWHGVVPPESHDAADRWYAPFRTPEVILYNHRTVSPEEVPADWDDLLDPKWKNRIIIRAPLGSSTMRTIWAAMILRQPSVEAGYAWLARLDANTKSYAADPSQLYIKLAREEGDLTLWNMADAYLQARLRGNPFSYVLPASGTPVLYDGIALVQGGPSPARAQQFYEFVTSDSALVEQATQFYRIPTRTDLPPDRLPDWITARPIPTMPLDWNRLAAEGPAWMQHWDEQIKGRGAGYLQTQPAP